MSFPATTTTHSDAKPPMSGPQLGRTVSEQDIQRGQHLQQPHYPRQSPSPTHQQPQNYGHVHGAHARQAYGHKRRDSDTLRSIALPPGSLPPTPSLPSLASPTLTEAPPRSAGSIQVSSSGQGTGIPLRSSPRGAALAAAANKQHKRSPTAPDVPTINGILGSHNGGNGDEYASEREREREGRRTQQQQYQQHQQAPPVMPAHVSAPAPPPAQLNRHMVVRLFTSFRGKYSW